MFGGGRGSFGRDIDKSRLYLFSLVDMGPYTSIA